MDQERIRFSRDDYHVLEELRQAQTWCQEGRSRVVTDGQLGELLASVFSRWALMGSLNLDLLNRQGGSEAVRLARYINEQGARSIGDQATKSR